MEADFSGYATKAGLKCSDGRTIMPNAFAHQDKVQVPLVWQHGHDDPANVLGHAVLENRTDGVYTYAYFNNTTAGQNAKQLVQHKDVNALSIFANQLVEKAKQVVHGMIREVSLVLAGANPGALIDYVNVAHSDGSVEIADDAAVIYTGLTLEHQTTTAQPQANDPSTVTAQDVYDTLDQEQKDLVHYMIGAALEAQGANVQNAQHSGIETPPEPKLDPNNDSGEGNLEHKEGTAEMARNVFETGQGETNANPKHTLTHADVKGIVSDAMKSGSLKDAVERYALQHGIDNIDILFPDARTSTSTPEFNKRRTEWVSRVLDGTRHSPFSRVKTIVADLTEPEARARGYIKRHYKSEEWFGVSKRTTSPTTIYKKQTLDRDDVLDITDFDVVAWLKGEMRLMLEEELARAILISDGRDVSSEDKIKDPVGAADGVGIRSILNDHELFVTTLSVNIDDSSSSYDEVVDAVLDGMEYYKGTGTPDFYTTIRTLNGFLKAKDGMGRRLYPTKADVAAALGVNDVITVEPMNEVTDLLGIIVNLQDYSLGADKGGEVSMFDDFDIDYNRQKYLIETRLSGGLTKIKSALVVKKTVSTAVLLAAPTTPTYDDTTWVVTIPTMANVVYKNADTSATLTAGAQTALTAGQRLNVVAVAATGYFFANNAKDQWTYFRRA
jgi:hypothetical protein